MRVRSVLPLLFLIPLLTGCAALLGEGTDKADLVRTLDLQTDLDGETITCIADAVYKPAELTAGQDETALPYTIDDIHDFTLKPAEEPKADDDDDKRARYARYLAYEAALNSAVTNCLSDS